MNKVLALCEVSRLSDRTLAFRDKAWSQRSRLPCEAIQVRRACPCAVLSRLIARRTERD